MFDPYHKWLGIPKDQRPPTHYQLLGIALGETDVEVIEEAAIRQTSHLRAYQIGQHGEACTRLLNEVAHARATLLDPAKRTQYEKAVLSRSFTAVTARPAPAPGTPFDDLESGAHAVASPSLVKARKPTSGVGLWIGLGATGLLGVVASAVVVAVLMHRDVIEPLPGPQPGPPVVPIKGNGDPQPARDPRDQLLDHAEAHWKLGLGPQHPKYPLLPAGAIEANLAADGPGARADAKVARLADGYFDAGRGLVPAGEGLTVYLRARDPLGRWDYGLFAKRGPARLAFNLFSGDTQPPPGPDIGFEVRTDVGYAKVSFPVTRIEPAAWHDLVGRYDGQKLQIICDGKVLDEKPLAGAVSQNNELVLIGAQSGPGGATRRFSGEMEEAALWTRALSDAEVARLTRTDKLIVALAAPLPPMPPPMPGQGFVEVQPGQVYRNGVLPLFVKVTPDGRYALFHHPEGIALWSVQENRAVRVLNVANLPLAHAAVSPDSKWLAAALPGGKVLRWEIESGKAMPELHHGGNTYALVFSPDSTALLSSGGGFKQTPAIKRWDVATGNLLQTFEGHRNPGLALAINDQHVLATDGARFLYRWDVKAGKLLDDRKLDSLTPFLRFAPDGSWVAHLRPDRFMLRDPLTDQEVRGAPLPADVRLGPYFDVTPDGRIGMLARSDTHELLLYDLVKGALIKTLPGHQALVRAVALAPDGRRAYSSDSARMFHVWKLDDVAAEVAQPKPETNVEAKLDPKFIPEWEAIKCPSFCSIAISPDGRKAVTAGPGVDVWDIMAGKHLRNLLPGGSIAGSVALSPDGTQAFAVAGDHVLRIWDVDTGRIMRTFHYNPDARPAAVAWAGNGKLVAVGRGHFVDIREADTFKARHVINNGNDFGDVHTVAFFADSSWVFYGMDNGAIRTISLPSGKVTTLFSHATGKVNQLTTVKDWILSAGYDRHLYMWDFLPRRQLLSRMDQRANVRAVAASPNGVYAVSGGDDQKIRFWNLPTRAIVHSYQTEATVRALAFAPNNRFFLSAGDDGQLRCWKLPRDIAK